MKKFLVALVAFFAFGSAAFATDPPSGPKNALIVTTCGTLPGSITYTAKQLGYVTVDTNGNLCPSTGGGGGGGAATIADGADVAEGARADAPATVPTTTSNATVIALLKAIANIAETAVPCLNATTSTTNTYTTGQTNSLNCDVHGNAYVNNGTLPEPCQVNAKTFTPINVSASGTVAQRQLRQACRRRKPIFANSCSTTTPLTMLR